MHENHFELLSSQMDIDTLKRYNTSEFRYIFISKKDNKLAQIVQDNKNAVVVANSEFDAVNFLKATKQMEDFSIKRIKSFDFKDIILKFGYVAICKWRDEVIWHQLNSSENKH